VDIDLFSLRSLLFLPASNPRAIAKARHAGADLVILDLEDAVKPDDKDTARAAAIEACDTAWSMPVAIRINGVGRQWHAEDIVAAAKSKADVIVVPDVRAAEDLDNIRSEVGRPVIAMVESAQGVLAAPAIGCRASALMIGTNDLANDLHLPRSSGRAAMQVALQTVILAARAAQIPALDGVFNRLDDEDGFAAECAEGKTLGFDGKSLIHPHQIAICHREYAPSVDDLAHAERLIAAATGGAERFEGAMVERMHVEAARRLIARAKL
jgi:citrate lyase subunit beta/citryl-CoA lyase